MNWKHGPAFLGVSLAIAITTAMDATGYTVFSALPLFPLAAVLWYLQGFSRQQIGLVWGGPLFYLLAGGFPIVVLGTSSLIAFLAGAVDTAATDWNKAFLNIALMSTSGVLMTLITEEGFFRGWLWASLRRAGQSDTRVLVWTTVAFMAWHLSAITLDTGFNVPLREVPIYLLNGTLLGLIWGAMRMASGSIVVPSVCHAIWNGLVYPLFGFGEKVGALGIQQTHWYGPEVGLVGVAVNLTAAVALCYVIRRAAR